MLSHPCKPLKLAPLSSQFADRAIVALFVAVQTEKGHAAWVLMKEARSEIRRVVWPNWDEVFQTTMIVLVLVFVFALILWLLDSGLSLLVSSVIG